MHFKTDKKKKKIISDVKSVSCDLSRGIRNELHVKKATDPEDANICEAKRQSGLHIFAGSILLSV